jgi:hypothetical protein
MICFRPLFVAVLGVLVGLLPTGSGYAQAFEQQVAPFPVRDTAGTAYEMPFLGGFNAPRPQLVDLDGDGDRDLFVQEQSGRLAYFEHTGAEEGAAFEWRTDDFQGLDVGSWARFGDLDGDGDPDLLAEEPIGNVRYYQNEGTASAPDFAAPVGPLTKANGDRLFANRQNVPALASLDCEGPPDLLLGRLNGRLRYLRHTGTRDEGTPVFELVSNAYQDVCVGPSGTAGPCPAGSGPSIRERGSARRHGANALAAGDLGGDGDPDLLWGDFFSESLYLLENTGSCDAPQIERVADVYPPDAPLQTSGYNAPFLGDVDGDDDLDLLVGVLQNTPVENLLFLENTGTDGQPDYTLRTRRFLSTLDVGGVSVPAVVELDGDGDRDLVIGNDREPGASSARLHVLENVGSSSDPVYEHWAAPLLPDAEPGSHFAPAFADVDADGDPDLFLGTATGTVRFYRNTGTPADPQFERDEAGDVELPRGDFATPALADIDADGDLDLFVGSSSGTGVVAFFRNAGSSEAPEFQLESRQYAGIQADVRRTHPAFADLEGDGTLDLYLGTLNGVSVYRNTGTPGAAAFATPPDSLALPVRSLAAPALADLDGDRRPDLLAGGDGGGLKFFAGTGEPITPPVSPGAGVQAVPNPFSGTTTLTFSLREAARVRLSVYDVMGRRVATLVDRRLRAAEHTYRFRGAGRASGAYLYVLRVGDRVRDRGRLVLVR